MGHSNTYPKAEGQFRISGYFKLHFLTGGAAQVSLAPESSAAATLNFSKYSIAKAFRTVMLFSQDSDHPNAEVWPLDNDGSENQIISLDFNITLH